MINLEYEIKVFLLVDALQKLHADRISAERRHDDGMKNKKNAKAGAALFCVILPVFLYLNNNNEESHMNTVVLGVSHQLVYAIVYFTVYQYFAYRANLYESKKELTDGFNTISDKFFGVTKAENVPGIKDIADMMKRTPLLLERSIPFSSIYKDSDDFCFMMEQQFNFENEEYLMVQVKRSIALSMVFHATYLSGRAGISADNLRPGDQVFRQQCIHLPVDSQEKIKQWTGKKEPISKFLNVFVAFRVCANAPASIDDDFIATAFIL